MSNTVTIPKEEYKRLVEALEAISSQGFWGHDTPRAVLVNIIDEYKHIADAALKAANKEIE